MYRVMHAIACIALLCLLSSCGGCANPRDPWDFDGKSESSVKIQVGFDDGTPASFMPIDVFLSYSDGRRVGVVPSSEDWEFPGPRHAAEGVIHVYPEPEKWGEYPEMENIMHVESCGIRCDVRGNMGLRFHRVSGSLWILPGDSAFPRFAYQRSHVKDPPWNAESMFGPDADIATRSLKTVKTSGYRVDRSEGRMILTLPPDMPYIRLNGLATMPRDQDEELMIFMYLPSKLEPMSVVIPGDDVNHIRDAPTRCLALKIPTEDVHGMESIRIPLPLWGSGLNSNPVRFGEECRIHVHRLRFHTKLQVDYKGKEHHLRLLEEREDRSVKAFLRKGSVLDVDVSKLGELGEEWQHDEMQPRL